MWRALGILWVAFVAFAATARADDRTVLVLPVTVHVLDDAGHPVASDERVRALMREVERYYEGASIAFDVVVRPSVRSAHLERIIDRRRLARDCVPRTLNVFLVSRIDDPVASASTVRTARAQGFVPTGLLGGAHVPAPGRTPSTYVIARAMASSLAHEMAHFLGEPHDARSENLMSYGRDRRGFDGEQLERVRTRAASLLRRRILEKRGRSSISR